MREKDKLKRTAAYRPIPAVTDAGARVVHLLLRREVLFHKYTLDLIVWKSKNLTATIKEKHRYERISMMKMLAKLCASVQNQSFSPKDLVG